MAAYNTKTPTMDFSSWLKRDFSTDNRGGALAAALTGFAETADAYGENADKELMSKYANETDASKIDGVDFYNKLNALNAAKVINDNKDRVYKDDQIARQNELNQRADAEYAIGVFNKEASNDALTMTKEEFDAKYNNAGGLDYGIMQKIFNDKEDRKFGIEDRNIKNNLTNLQIQETQNDINYKNSENAYKIKTREQENIDNQFLIDYNNGTINKNTLPQFGSKVSPKVYRAVIDEMNVNEIVSKYPDFATFKASEDWKNPNYTYSVKKTIYDSFGKGKETSVSDQIKQLRIDSNAKSLVELKTKYKEQTGNDMPSYDETNFLLDGKIPKIMTDMETKNSKTKNGDNKDGENIKEKTDKELRLMITGLQDLKRFKDSYNPSFTGPLDAFTGMVGDGLGFQTGDTFGKATGADEARFRTQLPLIVGPVVKAIYGGNASNADRENTEKAMPTFRDTADIWNSKMGVFYQKSLENMQTHLDVLKTKGYDTTPYEKEIEGLKKDWQNINNKKVEDTTNISWGNNQGVNSTGKNNSTTPITPIPPEVSEKLGITFE